MQIIMQQLSQQAVIEVEKNLDETIKVAFIEQGKIPLLVNEALCISVWREEIFPLLENDIVKDSTKNFLIYMLLYHETSAITLLESMLYHSEACKQLGDIAVDLIDYCAASITSLLSMKNQCNNNNNNQIRNYMKDLSFGVGMRCIALIQYLAEHMECLSLSAIARFYKTHDFPMLFALLIDEAPWEKRNDKQIMKYSEGQWFKAVEGGPVSRAEANAWLALHQLLLFSELGRYYSITEFARGQLTKLAGKITDLLLEQLPPLHQLKEGILKLSMFQLPSEMKLVILEIIPEIRNLLLREGENGWTKIVAEQTASLINCSSEHAIQIAERMCENLNFATSSQHYCNYCHRPATSRCSRCKKAWYCKRKCQVQHYSSHKAECITNEKSSNQQN